MTMMDRMTFLHFQIYIIPLDRAHGVATTAAFATTKISALHPSTKQKFSINVADHRPPTILGPLHKRLIQNTMHFYYPLEHNRKDGTMFLYFLALFVSP